MTAVGRGGHRPGSRHVTTRQAAFIGVGAMVGAGIFSLLGTAGEVAGSAVWVAFALAGDHRRAPGLLVRAAGRPIPLGGRPPRVREPGLRRGPHRDRHGVARVRREHHRDRDGGAVVRQLRERQRGRRLGRRGQGVRGAAGRGDDRAQRRRVHVGRPGLEPGRVHRRRDPRRVRGRHDRERQPGPPRAVHLSGRAGHRVRGRADVLRLPRLRRRHLHRARPRRPGPPAAPGDGDRDRDRRDDLHRRVHRRVRDADGSRGDRRRADGDRRRGPAGARPGRLLAHDRDGAVRDGRGDQRRALPGDRPVRPPRRQRPVSRT